MQRTGGLFSSRRRGFRIVAAAIWMTLGVIWAGGLPAVAAPPKIPDFCFLQISDVHIEPRPASVAPHAGGRSVDAIKWICGEAAKPQALTPYKITAPVPAFVIATGDLTEFGVIGGTWSDIERYFQTLPCPMYIIPGNHDNTWTAMLSILRKRHGGDSYSFDKFGCHFVGVNTASPQEPVACLDRRTLNWLQADLAKVKGDTPIILFMHHPLTVKEFADPFEQLRLLDVLEGHRIAVILDGHGHNATAGRWENIDRVMGGSTFGGNTGYNVISVVNGVLQIAYRFEGNKPMKALLEKPLFAPEPSCDIEIVSPAPGKPITSTNQVGIVAQVKAKGLHITGGKFDADAETASGGPLRGAGNSYRGLLNVKPLMPGWHFLRVTMTDDAKRTWERATAFEIAIPEASTSEWAVQRYQHDAGMKAAPRLCDGLVIVADTGGEVTALDPAFKTKWQFETGGEILGTPAVAGDLIVVGSGDGSVYGVASRTGKKVWEYKAAGPVYGQPAIKGDVAYISDNEGYIHAINAKTGRKVWAVKHAEFSIEQGGIVYDETFCVGAWDGFVYGVNLANGAMKWKQYGPSGQAGQKSRYYAPADCPPVLVGDTLFVTDRGYKLGMYQTDGKFIRELQKNCSGVGASEDGKFAYARTLAEGLTKYDGEGKVVWTQDVPLGRFPIQPTERGGKVYVCSNRGTLSILDAKDGKVIWQYQVAPQLHVMAGVTVDEHGIAYAVDMDGGLTAVGPRAAFAGK